MMNLQNSLQENFHRLWILYSSLKWITKLVIWRIKKHDSHVLSILITLRLNKRKMLTCKEELKNTNTEQRRTQPAEKSSQRNTYVQ